MADPFSLAASIIALLTAGYSITNKLSAIAETWKDAPHELLNSKLSMQHITNCLSAAMSLIETHSHLYTDAIESMLSDIAWQFKLLQDVISKCIKGKKWNWTRKLRWLFNKKRIDGFISKLEALKSSTILILQVAQLAQEQE